MKEIKNPDKFGHLRNAPTAQEKAIAAVRNFPVISNKNGIPVRIVQAPKIFFF